MLRKGNRNPATESHVRKIGQNVGIPSLVNLIATSAEAAEGEALLESNCPCCPALDRTSKSSHPVASPFKDAPKHCPIGALDEAFAKSISIGHPEMPDLIATSEQIGATLATSAAPATKARPLGLNAGNASAVGR